MIRLHMLLLALAFTFFSCKSNDAAPRAGNTVIRIPNKSFDFGTLTLGDSLTHEYVIANHGKTNLIINDIKTTCGCTVPHWDRNSIAPGDTTFVRVHFSALDTGFIHKVIVLNSNVDSIFSSLHLTGRVLKK